LPGSILANRRTLCESGHDRKELISMVTISGRMPERARRHENQPRTISAEAMDQHHKEHERRERGRKRKCGL
jgi:hypothetical protein